MARKLTALGVHIFAGGFTLGVKRAGFKVLGQLETSTWARETAVANLGRTPVISDHAEWFPFLDELDHPIDFVFANPPCAPFSNAGVSTQKAGDFNNWWRKDKRVECIHQTFEVLQKYQPTVWAFESVQGAWKRGRPLMMQLADQANELGYGVYFVLMNAAELGVPQIRRRFFFVASKVAIEDWMYPRLPKDKQTTVREALDGLYATGYEVGSRYIVCRDCEKARRPDRVMNREDWDKHKKLHGCERFLVHHGEDVHKHNIIDDQLLPHMQQGEGPRGVWERLNPPETWKRRPNGHVIGRPGFNSRRLRWDRPASTMIGGPCQYHPDEDRFLSTVEAQVLCGYPPSYEFVYKNSCAEVYPQIARAVMPPVGTWLAKVVKKALINDATARISKRVADLEKDKVEVL